MNTTEINKEEVFICEYCGKSFTDWRHTKSVRKKSPPRFCDFSCQSHYFNNKPGRKQKTSQSLKKYFREHSPEEAAEKNKKAREGLLRVISNGNWRPHAGKKTRYIYNNQIFDSSWEAAYARYLDQQSIKWIRNTERFEYFFEGKIHSYFPDFYLDESNQFVEIKGYVTAKDFAKWEQFPKDRNLKVLREKELKELFKVDLGHNEFKYFLQPDITRYYKEKSKPKINSKSLKTEKQPKLKKQKVSKKKNRRSLEEFRKCQHDVQVLRWELLKPFYGDGPTYGWANRASQVTGLTYSQIIKTCGYFNIDYHTKRCHPLSNPAKGNVWITNGVDSKLWNKEEIIPEGWWSGRVLKPSNHFSKKSEN